MSEIDILKANPRAAHDGPINRDVRLARFSQDIVCASSRSLLSAVCFPRVWLSDKCCTVGTVRLCIMNTGASITCCGMRAGVFVTVAGTPHNRHAFLRPHRTANM